MNEENCAFKLVDEIILYYDARSKNIKLQIKLQTPTILKYHTSNEHTLLIIIKCTTL